MSYLNTCENVRKIISCLSVPGGARMTPCNFKTSECLSGAFQVPFRCLALNLFWPSECLMLPSLKCQCTIIKLRQKTPYATIENYGILE